MHPASLTYPSLRRSMILDGLSEDGKSQFLDSCKVIRADADTILIRQGDPCPGMMLIASGTLEISTVDGAGHESVLHNCGPGDVVGDIELLSELPNLATCRAVTDVTVLMCPRALIDQIGGADLFMRNFARLAYWRMAFINRHHSRSRFMPVEIQIYATLLQLTTHSPEIVHPQSYVAGMVGYRVLGALRNDGIVELAKGRIIVADRGALRQRIN